jgi:hypothetical protein
VIGMVRGASCGSYALANPPRRVLGGVGVARGVVSIRRACGGCRGVALALARGAREREQGRGSFPPPSATFLQAPRAAYTPAQRKPVLAAPPTSATGRRRRGWARGARGEGRSSDRAGPHRMARTRGVDAWTRVRQAREAVVVVEGGGREG